MRGNHRQRGAAAAAELQDVGHPGRRAARPALQGRFDAGHALIVGQILAHIDFLDDAVQRLSAAIEEQIAPLAPAVELLCTIPASSAAPPRS